MLDQEEGGQLLEWMLAACSSKLLKEGYKFGAKAQKKNNVGDSL
jgi:hypothetical protein